MEVARLSLPTAIKQGLHSRAGNEFQATVQGILRRLIKGFQAVEPYGRDGDGGNDGYARDLGLYAQIYAPSSEKTSTREAAKKAARDFAKVKKKWGQIAPIKEYWFVMNSLGSNIHVERALSEIERRHGVKTRFVGSSELADEAMKMDRAHLEELLGFTVGTTEADDAGNARELEMLSSVDPKFLDGLHLLSAIAHPLVPELCESLLPHAIPWGEFWRWLDGRRAGSRGMESFWSSTRA